ncbi:hypothetical protein [Pseudonocardia sp. McavD-2-B]|uniref:hypothetical protein n=1 Tax=Pseudonocardia sp. McavD-2-B TaxID=2954499 RepID=UPI002096CEA3|nr:hypothetical protein [Pseudonocardia sp. McavD-2-B]MCO7195632.1 hypothetical protein [Pseudonocardia sp. McavD-2-B]
MSTGAAVLLSIVVAVVIVSAFSKPVRTMVGGFIVRNKDGSYSMKLTPATKKKRKGKKRR